MAATIFASGQCRRTGWITGQADGGAAGSEGVNMGQFTCHMDAYCAILNSPVPEMDT